MAYVLTDRAEIFSIDSSGMSSMVTKAAEMPVLFLSDGSRLLAIEANGRLLTVTPGGQTAGGQVDWGTDPLQPAEAVTWGSRLYVLDPQHNRLIRHQATDSGYGAGQPYLKDGTDLSRGVSLTVDGNLYILGSDGQVTKLRLGERQDFSLSPVEPPLTGAGKIRTDEKSKSLWILDPGNRRILSFSKETGTFEGQYVHDDLAEANDFLIDEANREALVAKGNAVLRFRLGE